jgi:putative membrane protein
MVLPGVSGSLLLLMLGQYEYMSTTLSRFTDGLVAAIRGNGTTTLTETTPTISVFLAGGVVGLFTVAHAVRWALDQYREATLAFLVSLIVGALRAPVEQTGIALSEAGRAWTPAAIAVFAVVAVVGAAVVVGVDRLAGGIAVGD